MSATRGEPLVLVIGDVFRDIIVAPHGPLVRGSDRAATIRIHPGGSGANQAAWLAAAGIRTRFAARVGADDQGVLATALENDRIEARLAADPDLPTGVLVTLLDHDGERSFLTDRGANSALCAADLPSDLLDGADMLLVSGYSLFDRGPRSAVLALMAAARARKVTVAVDAASAGFLLEVGPGSFLSWIEGADLLFANREEAALLAGSDDLDVAVRRLGGQNREVLVKLGADGAALGRAEGLQLSLPAPVVPVVDTTGAGDAFAAGFLASRLRREDNRTALAAAIRAGSAAVGFRGGRPALAADQHGHGEFGEELRRLDGA